MAHTKTPLSEEILLISVFASIFDFVLDQKSYVDFLHEYDVFA